MKIFKIVFVYYIILNLKGVEAQNYSTPDYAPLSLIIDYTNKTFGVTENLVKSLPIPQVNLYYGYSQFWYFNYYATSFASTINNISTILRDIFGNFSAATNDTKNFPKNFIQIQTLIQNFNNGSYVFPVWYAQDTFNAILNDYSAQLNNVAGFLSSTMNSVNQLKNGHFTINSANALKYLPSPLMIDIWLRKFVTVTNKYVNFVESIVKDMNSVYNLFKSSDSTLIVIEKQANISITNITKATNKTKSIVNHLLDRYQNEINNIYDNYVALIPQNVTENAQFQNDLLLNDAVRLAFNTTVTALNTNLQSILDKNCTNTAISIVKNYHQRELSVLSPRANIFTQYQKNISTLFCSSKLLDSSELALQKYGGPFALFNCSSIKNTFYGKLVDSVKEVTDNIITDANNYYTVMQQCLDALSDRLDDISLLEQCITSNGITVTQFAGIIQEQHSQIVQLVEYYAYFNNNKLLTCLNDKIKELLPIFEPIYRKALNCYNTTIISKSA